MNLYLLSLGCARNLVDSEIMLGRVKRAGWAVVDEPEEADVIVVNTCSFIEDAADESIEMILELASDWLWPAACRNATASKLPVNCRKSTLLSEPGHMIILSKPQKGPNIPVVVCCRIRIQENDAPRALSTSHMAYLKVAEGCSRHCTYCIIPKLRGKKRSRLPQEVIAEAQGLLESGVKELVLVAQDTTSYGTDLKPPASLSQLVEGLVGLPVDPTRQPGGAHVDVNDAQHAWIRVLYGHPESIDDAFIKTVASHLNVCSYFDIPIQHTSSSILKRMGRTYRSNDLRRLFDKIRSQVPEASLRTTIIVGFPGENEKDFAALLRFVEDIRFDHLGVFLYSDSGDLPSHALSGHVPAEVAQERYDQLMSCQLDISAQNYQKYIGQTLEVLVEEAVEDGLFAGRATFQAPEVDGMAYIKSGPEQPGPRIGSFSRIKVTDAMEYDLIGDSV
jgi:ribosomal protein S12 methylthiotransferase